MNKISVVVPCFNEEEVLSVFYKKTSEVLNEIDGITYELLFVDDGSKDHTKDILRALHLHSFRDYKIICFLFRCYTVQINFKLRSKQRVRP